MINNINTFKGKTPYNWSKEITIGAKNTKFLSFAILSYNHSTYINPNSFLLL